MDTPVVQLQGKGVHVGVARGYVRVLDALHDAHTLQPGEILVVSMVNAMWLPFIRKAAAIVVEGGGVTSPIATMLREFSLPAIVGAKDAARMFRSGDFVEVDAGAGIIRML